MFPLAHIYVSTKVAEKENGLLVLGSVIPDLAWFSGPLKGALHNQPDEFWDFVKEKYPDSLDLALGVKLRSQVGKGADYYSDDEIIGYAKINGQKIVKRVAMAFGITEGQQALGFSHNFIEAAVDLHLARKFPSLIEIYKTAIDGEWVEKVANVISDYLDKDNTLVKVELGELFALFSPENISTAKGVCSGPVASYLETILQKKLNYDQILDVINQAQGLTKDSFMTFLNETAKEIARTNKGDC